MEKNISVILRQNTLFLLVNLKIQSFLAINSYRILFSKGIIINR